jgi:PAS domain-containing protein
MTPSKPRGAPLARWLQRAAQPCYAIDANRRYVFVNGACAELLGLPADALLGLQANYNAPEQATPAEWAAAAAGPRAG